MMLAGGLSYVALFLIRSIPSTIDGCRIVKTVLRLLRWMKEQECGQVFLYGSSRVIAPYLKPFIQNLLCAHTDRHGTSPQISVMACVNFCSLLRRKWGIAALPKAKHNV